MDLQMANSKQKRYGTETPSQPDSQMENGGELMHSPCPPDSQIDNTGQLLRILQLSDSVFPTGGFSHSVGLESYARHGLLDTERHLGSFVPCALHNAGSLLLPYALHARQSESVTTWLALDRTCHACITNHVACRASVKQGRALLDSAAASFQLAPLQRLQDAVQDDRFHAHFPVTFGAVCKCLDIPVTATSQMFMFETLRNIITSAVRLGLIGPIEGQGIQYKAQQSIPDIVKEYQDLSTEEVYIGYPILEVVQNKHDTLFSKLFYS